VETTTAFIQRGDILSTLLEFDSSALFTAIEHLQLTPQLLEYLRLGSQEYLESFYSFVVRISFKTTPAAGPVIDHGLTFEAVLNTIKNKRS
jgi:hypothetical protein